MRVNLSNHSEQLSSILCFKNVSLIIKKKINAENFKFLLKALSIQNTFLEKNN